MRFPRGRSFSTPSNASQVSSSIMFSPKRLIVVIILLCMGIITMNFKYAIQHSTRRRNRGSEEVSASAIGVLASSASYSALLSSPASRLLPSRSVNGPSSKQQNSRDSASYLYNAIRNGERRAPRILIGIISSDSFNDCTYRKRHREVFEIWNDTRVCSLDQISPECQVAYTFILGAGNSSAPTQLVDDSVPLLVEKPIPTKHEDVNYPDTSLLNIRYVGVICYWGIWRPLHSCICKSSHHCFIPSKVRTWTTENQNLLCTLHPSWWRITI